MREQETKIDSQDIELPELDVTEADMATAHMVFGGRPTSLVVTRETQDLVMIRAVAEMACRNRQLRTALEEIARLKGECAALKQHAPRWIEQANGCTHWDDCWLDHRNCALMRIERYREALAEAAKLLELVVIDKGWMERCAAWRERNQSKGASA